MKDLSKDITPKLLRQLLNTEEEKTNIKGKTASSRATGARTSKAGDYLYRQDRGAFDMLLSDIKHGDNRHMWENLEKIYLSMPESKIYKSMKNLKLFEEFVMNEAAEKMNEFQQKFKDLVMKKLSKNTAKAVDVMYAKSDGIKPTQIQFDMEGEEYLDDDDQESNDIMSVLIDSKGGKFTVTQWVQMFRGNGGDDSKPSVSKNKSMDEAADIVAQYLKKWK